MKFRWGRRKPSLRRPHGIFLLAQRYSPKVLIHVRSFVLIFERQFIIVLYSEVVKDHHPLAIGNEWRVGQEMVCSVLWGVLKKILSHGRHMKNQSLRETRFPVSLHLSLSIFQSLLVICHFIPARLQLICLYFPRSQLLAIPLHFYFVESEIRNFLPDEVTSLLSAMVRMSSRSEKFSSRRIFFF